MHAYLYTLISLARQECTLLDCSPHFDSDLNGLVDNVVMSVISRVASIMGEVLGLSTIGSHKRRLCAQD